jgi:tripartite-type tricarboxylate transporter receptor subunit TctC
MFGQDARSQATRTIKFVVPMPAGGAIDILARLLADQISRAEGLTIVVENRAGAGTATATEAVSHAAPDGNTVLFMANAFVINPNLRKLNYDPLTSFEPICYLVRSPHVIAVNSASPYRTLADLLNAARAKPGELTLASIGPATSQQIGFEMLKRAAKVDMTFVPYPGNPPAVNALLGEHVTSLLVDHVAVAEQMKAGRVRALAVATRTRIEPLPDLPTLVESGYRDFESEGWLGVVVPAKTPKQKVSQLVSSFTMALQVPEVKSKLVGQGLYPAGICGADFGAFLREKYDEYGRVLREANIKAE